MKKTDVFHNFLKSCHLKSNTLVLNTLRKEIIQSVKAGKKYIRYSSIENFFIDSLATNKIKRFQKDFPFKEALILPIFSFENHLIGCIYFCFIKGQKIDLDKIHNIKIMVETVICPFNGSEKRIFTGKFIQMRKDIPLLTNKEKHILKKLLATKSYSVIAHEMHISINTVKTHIKHIYVKYKVKSKLELANKVNSRITTI